MKIKHWHRTHTIMHHRAYLHHNVLSLIENHSGFFYAVFQWTMSNCKHMSPLKRNRYYVWEYWQHFSSIHSKSFLTLTINKWNTMHIRGNLTWAWVLVCGRGRDRGATACHCRGPVLPSPATSPASSMSRRCPIVAWLRPAAMYLDTNPIQLTVQYIEITFTIEISTRRRPVTFYLFGYQHLNLYRWDNNIIYRVSTEIKLWSM